MTAAHELDPEVLGFVMESLPAPPARVLEVGAGDGRLTEALAAAGYELLAIDPAPPSASAPTSVSASVRALALHELREPPASFDAAVAVVSLHHVNPLRQSCAVLARALAPGGTLVLDEFDVERIDERAARWFLTHRQQHEQDGATPEEVIATLRHHCHRLADMQAALASWFQLAEPAYGPYLYRWAGVPALRETERELIAAGELPAIGARITGVLK